MGNVFTCKCKGIQDICNYETTKNKDEFLRPTPKNPETQHVTILKDNKDNRDKNYLVESEILIKSAILIELDKIEKCLKNLKNLFLGKESKNNISHSDNDEENFEKKKKEEEKNESEEIYKKKNENYLEKKFCSNSQDLTEQQKDQSKFKKKNNTNIKNNIQNNVVMCNQDKKDANLIIVEENKNGNDKHHTLNNVYSMQNEIEMNNFLTSTLENPKNKKKFQSSIFTLYGSNSPTPELSQSLCNVEMKKDTFHMNLNYYQRYNSLKNSNTLYNEELNILNQQKNENWKKIKIKTLIPVNLFISNQEGELKKLNFSLFQQNNKSLFYSSNYCVLNKTEFKIYKSKEHFSNSTKPVYTISLHKIIKPDYLFIKKNFLENLKISENKNLNHFYINFEEEQQKNEKNKFIHSQNLMILESEIDKKNLFENKILNIDDFHKSKESNIFQNSIIILANENLELINNWLAMIYFLIKNL